MPPKKKGPETKPEKLDEETKNKRLAAIYRKEKAVERAQAEFDTASQKRLEAQGKLKAAVHSLNKEIREQREGPGPLFPNE